MKWMNKEKWPEFPASLKCYVNANVRLNSELLIEVFIFFVSLISLKGKNGMIIS